MNIFLLGFIAVLVLSIIVIVHEFGHYIVAKKRGIWVEEFGLGLPPRVWGKKIGNTIYSLNLLPLGGFVRLHGETEGSFVTKPNKAYMNKSKFTRILVALAGIFMNFVLALVCFTIVYSITGIQRETGKVTITDVSTNSPAQTAGLLVGDVFKTINKNAVTNSENFISEVNANKGKKVTIEIERTINDQTELKRFTLTPRENPPEDQGALGVVISSGLETYYPPLLERPIYGIKYGIRDTINFTKQVFFGFAQISRDVTRGEAPKGVVGPVGIVAILAEVIKQGIVPILSFMGVISLNLAIFNLIPFPPLDGSRVAFTLIEGIVGKKYLPKVESIAHSVGFVILIGLLLLLTGREIPKLIQSGSLSGFVETLVK